MQKLIHTEDSASAFFLRIALGIVMLAHGLQQTFGLLGGIGLMRKIEFYHGFGVPRFFGFMGIMIVSVGAVLLILGLWGRLMAFLIGCFIFTAMLMGGHIGNGIFMNWEGQRPGEGFEYHILALGISIALMIMGSGKFSIDRLLMKRS